MNKLSNCPNFIELNTARNCLKVLLREYKIEEINLPYYICPAIWQACRAENCIVKFYHIDDNFMPTKRFLKSEYILYPNYFGICANNVLKLAGWYENLIVDNAHAFYMPYLGLASIYSYRKFFNVADGAKLIYEKSININFKKAEDFTPPKNYSQIVQNELRLNKEEIKLISNSTQQQFKNIDFEKDKKNRLEKFLGWHEKLGKTNLLKFELSEIDVPFVYPYLSEKDYDFKNLLIYRYWNSLPKTFNEYKFYKYLKPIPLVN